MNPDIAFEFEGRHYLVESTAYDKGRIVLPDGRMLEAAWSESFPPQPKDLHELNHTFKSLTSEKVANLMNASLAKEIVGAFSGKKHPEELEGEVFLTNADGNDMYNKIGWTTKRKGKMAYNIYGQLLSGCFPIFVQRSELIQKGINPDELLANN